MQANVTTSTLFLTYVRTYVRNKVDVETLACEDEVDLDLYLSDMVSSPLCWSLIKFRHN